MGNTISNTEQAELSESDNSSFFSSVYNYFTSTDSTQCNNIITYAHDGEKFIKLPDSAIKIIDSYSETETETENESTISHNYSLCNRCGNDKCNFQFVSLDFNNNCCTACCLEAKPSCGNKIHWFGESEPKFKEVCSQEEFDLSWNTLKDWVVRDYMESKKKFGK